MLAARLDLRVGLESVRGGKGRMMRRSGRARRAREKRGDHEDPKYIDTTNFHGHGHGHNNNLPVTICEAVDDT